MNTTGTFQRFLYGSEGEKNRARKGDGKCWWVWKGRDDRWLRRARENPGGPERHA